MMPCDLPAERPPLPLTVEGGCHCGAVRFRATLRTYDGSACNCSMCAKKAYVHLIVPRQDFTLLTDPSALATYRFNTGTAAHHFCKTCGVHSFYVPRSHPDGFSLNARCVDDIEPGWLDLEPFDGRNWEANIHTLR
jgi:hypothetical protein